MAAKHSLRRKLVIPFIAAGWSMPALAAGDCPPSYICANDPEGVVKTLQVLGYKAVLDKSSATGNPKIASSAAGFNYELFFYGCDKGQGCNSLGFLASFDKDPANSAELVNEWNREKRFSTMSYDPKDGSVSISYDLSTVGGLSQPNFADVVTWWETMLGQVRVFFDAHPAAKKK